MSNKNKQMILLIAVWIGVFLTVSSPGASAQTMLTQGGLNLGPYAVSFKSVDKYDYSRSYKPKTDYEGNAVTGERARPIQISIWYPAAKTSAVKMSYEEYLNLYPTEVSLGTATEDERAKNLKLWAGEFTSMAGDSKFDATSIIKSKTGVIKNASVAKGLFPLIVYSPGAQSESFDNSVLCEFLASHGYIVAASPSAGMNSHPMTTDLSGLEAQTRDMEFLLGYMRDFSSIDPNKLTVMGWSWGGMAGVLLQMRNTEVDAVVSLDGSISGQYYPVAEQAFGFDLSKVRVPYMLMVSHETNENREQASRFYNKLKYADAYLLKFDSLAHVDFSSYRYLVRTVANNSNRENAAKKLGYEAVCRYTLHFLNAYLKNNAESLAFLQNRLEQNAIPQEVLLSKEAKKAQKAPPTKEQFINILRKSGITMALQIYKEVRQNDPDYVLFEEGTLNQVGFDFFNNLNRKDEAIEIMKLNVEAYPQSYKARGYLARIYEKYGDKRNALINYSIALGMALKDKVVDKDDVEYYRKKVETLGTQ